MLSEYLPIAVLFLFAIGLGLAFLGLSAVIGKKRPTKAKLAPYECGVDQASNPRQRFSIHFFLVAILFLLFDVEVTFLFPWAILVRTFRENGMGPFIVTEGLLFIAILGLGLAYVWKKRALDWEQ